MKRGFAASPDHWVAEAVKAFEGHRITHEMLDAFRYEIHKMLDAFRYQS